MQDFFSTYSRIENPTWEMIIFSFILSFLLSGLVAFTYGRTTKSDVQPSGMIHALVGGPVIATMILQSIGDNIASGLGMLGALTIVRYRTNLNSPRDAVFVFAALGIGISCGLYGFIIATFGTVMFSIVSFVIFISRVSSGYSGELSFSEIKIKSNESMRLSKEFIDVMDQHCLYWNLRSFAAEKIPATGVVPEAPIKNANNYVYVYKLQFQDDEKQKGFLKVLKDLDIPIMVFKTEK